MEILSKNKILDSRILITGGLGFVGASIAKRLLREGVKEIVLFDMKNELPDILSQEKGSERIEIVSGDICNPEHVNKAVAGCDYVFHEAGLRVTRCVKEPRLGHEILVDGTFNVALACVENRVKKLIHASSAIVYGEPVRLPLDEEHPAHDATLYGISKIANENLLRSFGKSHGLHSIALRYFNIYGPGMNLFGPEVEVLIRWLDRLDEGLSPVIFGDGKQTLDYIFIEDVVEANWLALLSRETEGIFNVCTGNETSVLKLLQLLLAIRGSSLQPEFQQGRVVNQVARRFGSPDKAQKCLGFNARVSLEKGLKQFIDWRDQILVRKKSNG